MKRLVRLVMQQAWHVARDSLARDLVCLGGLAVQFEQPDLVRAVRVPGQRGEQQRAAV